MPAGLPRLYSTYALIDEAYAVTSSVNGPLTGPRVLTIQAFINLSWVLSGIVGALVGQVLPAGTSPRPSSRAGLRFSPRSLRLVKW